MSLQTNEELSHKHAVLVACATLCTLLALVGNVAVLYNYVHSKLLKYVHSLLIFNICICNCLLATAILFLYVEHLTSKKSGARGCLVLPSVVDGLQLEQCFILVLIISDRIMLIKKGLMYSRQRSIPWAGYQVIFTWVLSTCLGFLDVFVVHKRQDDPDFNYFCNFNSEILVDVIPAIIVLLLTVSFIVFIYLGVKVRMSIRPPTSSRHRLLNMPRRSIVPVLNTMRARDDLASTRVVPSSADVTVLPSDHQLEDIMSVHSDERPIVIGPHRSLSLTNNENSGGTSRFVNILTPVTELELKPCVDDSDNRSDPGNIRLKEREAVRPRRDSGNKMSLKPEVSGVSFVSSVTMLGMHRTGEPPSLHVPEPTPIGDQRRHSAAEGPSRSSRKISWPSRPDQSLLPLLLRRMTKSGQREVFAVLEIGVLLLVQILFTFPECLISLLLFAGVKGDLHTVHFYIQWTAFGPTLVYPVLYSSCHTRSSRS